MNSSVISSTFFRAAFSTRASSPAISSLVNPLFYAANFPASASKPRTESSAYNV